MVWPAGYKLQGGQYTIEKELGEGGFGVAYLARNAKSERVVIKTLNDTVQQRPDFDNTDVYALAATLYVILTGQMPEPAPVRAAGTPYCRRTN